MSEPLYSTTADGYDTLFARVTRLFIPALLQAARITSGHHVLDVATGTGAAAQAAAAVVGPGGSVIGGDISPSMLNVARRNLQGTGIGLELLDGHALPYGDGRFDAVICQLGLMFFDDQVLGLSEFRRVLRVGGWTAVSVTPAPERSLFGRIGAVIGRHVPAKAEMFNRLFSIPDAACLDDLLTGAGFRDVHVQSESREITFASFDDYFRGTEEGSGLSGQEYVRLPQELRQIVREEVCQTLPQPAPGEPLVINMGVLIGSGRK
jgi:ubiquinone/menaquinone biosynthesis C-methylase UbiE